MASQSRTLYAMAYYASERAADVLGVPGILQLGTKAGSKLGGAFQALTGEMNRERSSTQEASFEQRVHAHVATMHHRNVARALQEAVQISQVIDVTMDLLVGRMRFFHIPGSHHSLDGSRANVEAFWAVGTEELDCPSCRTHLILVGSLDGLVGTGLSSELASFDGINFPSDPDSMIEILNEELQLGVDLEDYEYAAGWSADDSTNGRSAATAMKATERAGGMDYNNSRSWARRLLPAHRIIAIISDIHVMNEANRIVLARPVCITATV